MKWYVILLEKDGWFSDEIDDVKNFDFDNTCMECMSGARFKKELAVKKMPKYDIDVTILRDFVFSKSILEEIVKLGVSENNFKQLKLLGIDFKVGAMPILGIEGNIKFGIEYDE